jgi:hypothetical protein
LVVCCFVELLQGHPDNGRGRGSSGAGEVIGAGLVGYDVCLVAKWNATIDKVTTGRCERQGTGAEVMWHREVTWNTHDRR